LGTIERDHLSSRSLDEIHREANAAGIRQLEAMESSRSGMISEGIDIG
jgi:hypothetical protein